MFKICNQCGIRFKTDKSKALFCSRKCRGISDRKGKMDKCKCGKEFYAKPSLVKIGRGKFCSCLCANTKENNPAWKGGISPEHESIRASMEYGIWRTSVFNRDMYTCQDCGTKKSGVFEAHHLKGFSEFKELRFVVSNGVTLCDKCHKLRHRKLKENGYIKEIK